MTALEENLERLEEAIAQACRAAGRARGEVELMAVSKTFPAETIAEAAALGLTLFGENRVQEFGTKALHAADLWTNACESGCSFHLIGHLQSNKAARAAELFDGVDSLDSVRLAERLNEAAGKCGKRLPVLIEVKLSPEETKAGLDPESDEAARLLERPSRPSASRNARADDDCAVGRGGGCDAGVLSQLACFARDRWAAAYPKLNFDVLSMGMSGDFALAIARGRDAHSRGHGAVWRAPSGEALMLRAAARWSDARGARAAGREEDGDHGHLRRRGDSTTEDCRTCAAARRPRE